MSSTVPQDFVTASTMSTTVPRHWRGIKQLNDELLLRLRDISVHVTIWFARFTFVKLGLLLTPVCAWCSFSVSCRIYLMLDVWNRYFTAVNAHRPGTSTEIALTIWFYSQHGSSFLLNNWLLTNYVKFKCQRSLLWCTTSRGSRLRHKAARFDWYDVYCQSVPMCWRILVE